MTKFKDLPLYYQVAKVYILSILAGLLLSPLFNWFYVLIFKPKYFGEGLFFPLPEFISTVITGFFFGIFLLLPLFVFWLLKDKQWKILGIGMIIPVLMIFDSGTKHILWALILSTLGWLLAQGVLLIRGRVS